MAHIPPEPELPFISDRRVSDFLSHILRRQPEGESAEVARLKLLEEFDLITEHMNSSTYRCMDDINEELQFIAYEMTRFLEYISGLRKGEQVMAGRGSTVMTMHQSSIDFAFTNVPQHQQLHGRIDRVEAVALNYDLTSIQSTTVPRAVIYKPFIVLTDVFSVDELTAEVKDTPNGYYEVMLPLDDETLDLRKSLVLHEPHKTEFDI